MAQAKTDNSTSTSALQEQLKAAGMRLVAQSGGRDRYLILWKHQAVARDMTLIEAARFINRALVRR